VRCVFGVVTVFLLLLPVPAKAQSIAVQGSAGPTLSDGGVSLAAGIGFSPISRVTLLAQVERTEIFSRFRDDGRGSRSAFRGGTVTLGTAEVRAALRGRDRWSPYVLGGFGVGVSRPNVNETFPDRVSNTARVIFYGGGVHVPVRDRLSVFADARVMIGDEAGELLAIAPLRAGLTWQF
jgi:hypothetical protein